ncbi:hypothetical protein [Capsulimonas corticalis]|nr:hypothetical protein [Capsulimonas corticalis]
MGTIPASARPARQRVRAFGQGRFGQPWGIAVDRATGRVYVTDHNRSSVSMFDGRGRFLGRFGGLGRGPGKLLSANFVVADGAGDVYVTDTGYHEKSSGIGGGPEMSGPPRVERFDRDGHFRNELRLSENSGIFGAASAPGGGIILVLPAATGRRLVRYSAALRRPRSIGPTFQTSGATHLSADRQGYWAEATWDTRRKRLAGPPASGEVVEDVIVRIDVHGRVGKHVSPDIAGSIVGIATDQTSGRLYVAESVRDVYEVGPNPATYGTNRVRVYDRNGKRIAAFPVQRPNAMAIGAHGDVYITTNREIQVFRRGGD